jgi:hypothetical protein
MRRMGRSKTANELFDELSFYTLAHGSPRFLHQHAVDAFAAQMADESTKTIKIFFGLMGLYLYLEKGFTGREVQRAHMNLAKKRAELPRPPLPLERGAVTVKDVMAAEPGGARDQAIGDWCASVWEAYREARPLVAAFLWE